MVAGVPSAPTINSVTVSSSQASIAFTSGTNNGSVISGYQYSTNNGSNWISAVGTSSPIIVTGLTNGTNYIFLVVAVNTIGSGASSNSVTTFVRPSLPELKSINSVIVDYNLCRYILSDLVNSFLFTLLELILIGYELPELKTFFSNDAIIILRYYSGSELKKYGIIQLGIVYFDFLIIGNVNNTYNNSLYSLTNDNLEIIKIIILDNSGATVFEISNCTI